jgi:putative ABC transport system ATP-binding protein
VAIARALVNNPTLLLADEPTGNLDSRTSLEVVEVLQHLNAERNLTILLVTHERDIAQYAARRVSFLDGRIRIDEPVISRRIASADLATMTTAEEMVVLSA